MGRGVWISGLGRNVVPSVCSGKFLRVVLIQLRRIGGDRQGGVCIRRQAIHLLFGDSVPYRDLIARIRNPEYTSQIYEIRDAFALSLTVNPERQAAEEIEKLLKYPGFLRRDTFANGRVEIVELRINPDSKLCNRPLSQSEETPRTLQGQGYPLRQRGCSPEGRQDRR